VQTDQGWIEEIHMRLLTRYADKWLQKWDGLDMAIVRADWARELDGVTTDGVLFALAHLPPTWPPNAAEFRELIMQRPLPTTAQPRLAGPRASKEAVAEGLARLNAVKARFEQPFNSRPLAERAQWALDLQQREADGYPLTDMQRQAWRTALQVMPLETIGGNMRGVARDQWPESLSRPPEDIGARQPEGELP
jgi:hypothetical protein